MSVHEHRSHADTGPLRFGVVTVSTSRTPSDDRSGDLCASRIADAGHKVIGRKLVTDDIDAIRGAVRDLRLEGARVIVTTGGTGFSSRDVTPEAVEALFQRTIPGFGELFRMLSFEQIGAAAMLSRATAGVFRETVVFSMPGSTKACQLGLDRLVLPEVGHLLSQLDKEQRSLVPDATPQPAQGRISLSAPSNSAPPEAHEEGQGRWQQAVAAMGGEIQFGPPPPLPDQVARLAPVTSVLDSAGERGTLVLGDRRLGLYGWPDLRRPGSKVLAIGEGQPLCEVIALHRQPTPTGTAVPNGVIASPGEALHWAEATTGALPAEDGTLFALTADTVWYRTGERAVRWDGRSMTDDGTCKQVLASLLLDWHQR